MSDAFDLRGSGTALISFSGGKTSAYMTRKILDHGIDDEQYVVFADTGLERDETYRFVDECERRWGIEIFRVRYGGHPKKEWPEALPRDAHAFEILLAEMGYLPGGGLRFCTTELKIRVMKRFMLDRGHDHWDMVVGIRADEPRRYARLNANHKDRWEHVMPLYPEGVTLGDVEAFWSEQPFTLELRPYEGNCTLCHLKKQDDLMRIMVEHPKLVDWWIKWEDATGKRFRDNGRSYRQLEKMSSSLFYLDNYGTAKPRQMSLPILAEFALEDVRPCMCGD